MSGLVAGYLILFYDGTLVAVTAMRGSTALLPCNIHATAPKTHLLSNKGRYSDPVLLVLWYKNASITPVYSYDSRGKTSGPGGRRQWGDESVWGEGSHRAWFDTTTTPANLRVRNVKGTDEGTYRCKVDFKSSPSWSQRINLIVKDPPGFPRIQDESGSRLEGRVGPYSDGALVKIMCQSSGEPPPQLEWEGAGSENRGRYDMSEDLSTSRLTIVASRATAGASISCSATTNVSGKLKTNTTSIIFRVKLAPLSVSMESPGFWVVGGQQSKFGCRVVGGRPNVVVQWLLSGHQLKRNIKNEKSQAGNVTLSTVQFIPKPEHDNMPLVCKAFAEDLPHTVLQDQITLQVRYVPETTIQVSGDVKVKDGSGSVDIKENKNLIFSCHVKANPPAYNISWFHNGKLLKNQGVKNGVIIDQQTLRLVKVSSSQHGLYTCAASNDEGDGPSNAINLNVYYAPFCKQDQQSEYFVERRSSVTVTCEVEAFPPEVTFSWAIDNDQGNPQHLPSVGRPEQLRGKYTLTNIKDDHLRVLCWATNMMGLQKEACLFNILTHGRPEAVADCTVTYHTASGFLVQCPKKQTFPGGLETTYNLQVYLQTRATSTSGGHSNEGKISTTIAFGAVDDLVRNITNKHPFFVIRGLPPGREFLVAIRASNSEGTSPPSTFSAFTLRDTAQTLKGMPSATTGSGSTGSQPNDKEEGIASETKGKNTNRLSEEDEEVEGISFGGSSIIPLMMIVVAASLTLIVLLSVAIIIGIRRQGITRSVEKELEQVKINEELPYMQTKEPSSVSSERTEETPTLNNSSGGQKNCLADTGDNYSRDLLQSSFGDGDMDTTLLVHNIDLGKEYKESKCVSLHPSPALVPMRDPGVSNVVTPCDPLTGSSSSFPKSSLAHQRSMASGVLSLNPDQQHLINTLSGQQRTYQPLFPSVAALSSPSPTAQITSVLPLSYPRPPPPPRPPFAILSSTLPKRGLLGQTISETKMRHLGSSHSINAAHKQAQNNVDYTKMLSPSPVPLLGVQQLATNENSHPPFTLLQGSSPSAKSSTTHLLAGSEDESSEQKPTTVKFHPIIHVNIVPDLHSNEEAFPNGDHGDSDEKISSL